MDINETLLIVAGLVSCILRFCYNFGKLNSLGASASILVIKMVLSCSPIYDCRLDCCRFSSYLEID